MASMTVRNLDEDVKRRFVEKAKAAGQSAEAYLRLLIAREATAPLPAHEAPSAEGEQSEWMKDILRRAQDLSLTEKEQAEMDEGMRSFRGDR